MFSKKPHRVRMTQDPCLGCYLHKDRCICAFTPRLDLKTKVSLVVHVCELQHTTNTGRLAVHSLVNSEMLVRGDGRDALDLSTLLTPDYRSVLFFPTPDAIELGREFIQQSSLPIQLIVPDGNWRQASKVHRRHRELDHLPRVKLCLDLKSTTRMRRPPHEFGLATMEAIAYALGIIEGESVQNELLDFYQRKVDATLDSRGIKNLPRDDIFDKK